MTKSCPCHYITPCSDNCTCAKSYMSGGCMRCCSYGSIEQRQRKAEWLAEKIKADITIPLKRK